MAIAPIVTRPQQYIDLNYQGPTNTQSYLIAQQNYTNVVKNYTEGTATLEQVQIAQQNLNSFTLPKGEVYGPDSIKQVMKMILSSYPGDYLREMVTNVSGVKSFKGGVLYKYVGKVMNDANKTAMYDDIKNVVSQYPNIVLSQINITPDYIGNRWKIQIIFSDVYNKFTDQINTAVQAGNQ